MHELIELDEHRKMGTTVLSSNYLQSLQSTFSLFCAWHTSVGSMMEASIRLETVDENGVWQPLRFAHACTSVQQDASRLAKDLMTNGVVETGKVGKGRKSSTAHSGRTPGRQRQLKPSWEERYIRNW